MKTTVTFNDDEEHLARIAVHSPDISTGLWDMDNKMRSMLKHDDLTDEACSAVEQLRDLFYERFALVLDL